MPTLILAVFQCFKAFEVFDWSGKKMKSFLMRPMVPLCGPLSNVNKNMLKCIFQANLLINSLEKH